MLPDDKTEIDTFGPSGGSIDISIILPCYRAAELAIQSAQRLSAALARSQYRVEILVVDDGGKDIAPIWPWAAEHAQIRLIQLHSNKGKGGAVRAGMLAAKGDVLIFTDVDLPYELDLFEAVAQLVLKRGFHGVIGDRTLSGSSYALELTWKRRLASAVFSIIVGRLVTGGFFDTQCGLKGFRADVAQELFRLGRIDRFAFDVELIYLCLIHKLDIKRIPVRLQCNETSSMRLFTDSLCMFCDLLSIKVHSMAGTYHSSYLYNLVSNEFKKLRRTAVESKQLAQR